MAVPRFIDNGGVSMLCGSSFALVARFSADGLRRRVKSVTELPTMLLYKLTGLVELKPFA